MTGDGALRARHRADVLIALLLSGLAAAVVVWQNTRLGVLWDLSYILENAARIAAGQVPYRDFPFPYAPLTFVVQALIIRLFGHAVWHHVAYAAVAGGAATGLTYGIVRTIGQSRVAAMLLAAPLVVLGIYCIFPHPFYDPDSCLAILAIVYALMRSDGASTRANFAIGCAAVVPLFVKQNIGLAFLLALAGLVVVSRDRRRFIPLLAGVGAGLVVATGVIALGAGVGNYLRWTIQFAAERRLPPLSQELSIYNDATLWWWIAVVIGGVVLSRRWRPAVMIAAIPFLWSVWRLVVSEDPFEPEVNLLRVWPLVIVCGIAFGVVALFRARGARAIAPLLLVATILGTFLSQVAWGSSYGIWPLLIVVIAFALNAVESPFNVAIAGSIALALLAAGIPYVVESERLTYVDLGGSARRSSLPALRGLTMAGEWLPDFEQLVAWTGTNIPRDDAILCFPGEDLFYFSTARVPRFPVLMFDRTVNPYDVAQLLRLADERSVKWVVVKLRMQMKGAPFPSYDAFRASMRGRYEPVAQLRNYTIYRRGP